MMKKEPFMGKQTITSIQKAKGVRKLSMITAYDALFAKLFDAAILPLFDDFVYQ